jgi:GH24 family phage-related lysozyme (muramidase)
MESKTKAKVLALAVAIAIPMEGIRTAAYFDPVGIPTICFGMTHGVKMGDFRTIPECKALLTKEMSSVIEAVDTCRPGLPTNVLAAFSDAAYNIGPTVACDTNKSTAARKLKAGDYSGACNQLPRWSRATVLGVSVELPGLVKRRNLELHHFSSYRFRCCMANSTMEGRCP